MASKKIKKLLKKAGKAAAIGAALYGGSKLLGKKYNTSPVSVDSGRGSDLRGLLASAMPKHLTHDMGASAHPALEGSSFRPRVYPGTVLHAKKGGRVTGMAKRGFGRALMKGKK